MSGCVEAAFLVEGMVAKPHQGIFMWMSSQNPQCLWAQRGSDQGVTLTGPQQTFNLKVPG